MRTLDQIQTQILGKIAETPELAGLTSTSKVAIWRLWVYIIAFIIWFHEAIVEENAKNSRVHTLDWYRGQALAFQDGVDLIWTNGGFNFATVDNPEERMIIKRCAVLENTDGQLVFKVATENNGVLEPLNNDQLFRFSEYLKDIRDGGNRIKIINRPADKLKIELDIYVDALTIDLSTGEYLQSDNKPKVVNEAIDTYLANLEFNGAFVKTFFIDAIQKVDGVKIPKIKNIQWKYGDIPYAEFTEFQIPDAGYFEIEDLKINYLAYDLANG